MSNAAAILTVDDNATVRKAVSLRLNAKGFDVVSVADGEAALALLGMRSFDLVLLDLQMPGMRGDEVLRRLRLRYAATELPVIMLAGSSDAADINLTLELGANDYIIKPGDLPLLVARIRTQLALRDTVQRLREHSATMRETLTLEPVMAGAGMLRRAPGTPPESALTLPFDLLHDHTPMTCFTLTRDGTILHANRFGAQLHGYRATELLGRSLLDLYASEDRGRAQEQLASLLDLPGRVQRWDIRHLKHGGDLVWMRDTARAVRHRGTTLVLLTCEDIDDSYKLNELLSFQARHDELTGLANRKALEERLQQVIDSACVEHTEHALVLVDLDQFKLINDTCGQIGGDDILRQVARALRGVARRRDILARTGSDTFALLTEDCTAAMACTAAELMRRAIEMQEFTWQARRCKLTASIGVVSIDAECETPAQVLNMADLACAAAKDSGRNTLHVYQPDNPPLVTRRGEMRWAARLTQALDEDRFTLTFQPISPLVPAPHAGAHYEILVRMRDEVGRLIMPGDFLPAAERYHLAARLDRWVIGTMFTWLEQHPAALDALGLCSINLSAQSIGIPTMLEFIRKRFARGAVPPHKICFELTETAAIADLVQATRFMQQLKGLGCRFALDDFGSGFSSLTYLKQLPIDFLKIDGSFVRDMALNSVDFAMVRSINDIGHVMGKQTIAEFVENDATVALLLELGVDYAQGYGIGRPAPLADLLEAS